MSENYQFQQEVLGLLFTISITLEEIKEILLKGDDNGTTRLAEADTNGAQAHSQPAAQADTGADAEV
jgi:hypothetical protein